MQIIDEMSEIMSYSLKYYPDPGIAFDITKMLFVKLNSESVWQSSLTSIDSNINQELLKTTFRDISSLIQRLGMKLLFKDFFEADIVFNELLNKTTIIYKNT